MQKHPADRERLADTGYRIPQASASSNSSADQLGPPLLERVHGRVSRSLLLQPVFLQYGMLQVTKPINTWMEIMGLANR